MSKNIKFGKKFRHIKYKNSKYYNFNDHLLKNEHITFIHNYINENFPSSDNGILEISVPLNYVIIKNNFQDEPIITDGTTTLTRYVKIYLKFHDIYFDSFEYFFDPDTKTPCYKLIIDLNLPYLD